MITKDKSEIIEGAEKEFIDQSLTLVISNLIFTYLTLMQKNRLNML